MEKLLLLKNRTQHEEGDDTWNSSILGCHRKRICDFLLRILSMGVENKSGNKGRYRGSELIKLKNSSL